MRVLFVEDEPRDYRLYIEAVAKVVTERNGTLDHVRFLDETLRHLGEGAYDVIVLDLNIPLGKNCPDDYEDSELNGKYVVNYLRDHGMTDTRIVCLTNYGLKARSELGEYPNITILPKSCTRAVLTQAVFP
jgi:CheY-like chemotaxis protein